jgi:hypothetical protein
MSNTTTDYLTSTIIKDDPWVKGICTAASAEDMVALIMRRISSPAVTGPTAAFLSRTNSPPELPSEIIYDLVINSYADYDLADEAMGIIMKRVLNKEIAPDPRVLENVFHLIEQLVLEKCSDDLYQWVKENISYMDVLTPPENKRVLLNAINALAYAQKEDAGLESFWASLWEQSNQYWWNAAFHGIRYSDLDKAIELIPMLIDRKCSNVTFLLTSMWRVKDDERIADALKKGIRANDAWAGMAVNFLVSKMKYSEKTLLLERLHDTEIEVSTEEEDHLQNLEYFGGVD